MEGGKGGNSQGVLITIEGMNLRFPFRCQNVSRGTFIYFI